MAHVDGDIAILREATGGDTYDSTTPTTVTMDTEVRGDNDYAKATSDLGLTMGDGWHLVMYNLSMERTDVTAGRSESRATVFLDGTVLSGGLYGASSGYIRRGTAGENFGSCNGATLVQVTSGPLDLTVRHARTDSDTATVHTEAAKCGLMALKIPDSDSRARVRGVASQAMSTSDLTYTTLTVQTEDEMTTADFSRSDNVITLKTTGHYLVTYSVDFSVTANTRTGTAARCTLNGTTTAIDGSQSFNYSRTTDSCTTPINSGCFIMSATANDTIQLQAALHKSQGTIGGNATGMSMAIWFIESGSRTGSFLRLGHDTDVDITTTETAQVWQDQDEIDTADFTHSAGSASIDVDNTGDYLFLSQMIHDRLTITNSARENTTFRWTKEGTNQTYGAGAGFVRGDGGADAVTRGGQHMAWLGAATAADTFTITVDGVDGAATDRMDATYLGLQAFRLDNLFAAGTPTTTTIDGDNITVDTRASVAMVGTDYGVAGTGSFAVTVSDNATFGVGTETVITSTYNSATSITVTMEKASDNSALDLVYTLPGTHYVYVTDSTGTTGAGKAFTLKPAGATWLADEDADYDGVDTDTPFRIRSRLAVTVADWTTPTIELWAKEAAGSWFQVTSTSGTSGVELITSGNTYVVDGADVDEALLSGSGTLITNNNGVVETSAEISGGATVTTGNFIETEHVVQFAAGDASNNEVYTFRLRDGTGTEFGGTYVDVAVTVDAAGGTAYTLNCDAGSYTYTGQTIDPAHGRTLELDAGAYTYSGQTIDPSHGRTIELDAGSYTYTGQTIDPTVQRILALDTGAYTYTGQTIDPSWGRTIELDAGAYTYSGLNPEPTVQWQLTLDLGSYTYTGQEVTLTYFDSSGGFQSAWAKGATVTIISGTST